MVCLRDQFTMPSSANRGRRNDEIDDDGSVDDESESDDQDSESERQPRQKRQRQHFSDEDERESRSSPIIYHYIFVGMMILLCLGSVIAVAFVKDEARTAFSAVFSLSFIILIIYLIYWRCGRKKKQLPVVNNHYYNDSHSRGQRNGRK